MPSPADAQGSDGASHRKNALGRRVAVGSIAHAAAYTAPSAGSEWQSLLAVPRGAGEGDGGEGAPLLVAAGERGEVSVFRAVGGELTLLRHSGAVFRPPLRRTQAGWCGLACSGGSLAVAAEGSRAVAIVDLSTLEATAQWRLDAEPTALCFMGGAVVTAEGDVIRRWAPDGQGGVRLRGEASTANWTPGATGNVITSLEAGSDQLCLACGSDRLIYGVDLAAQQVRWRFRTPAKAATLRLLPARGGRCYYLGADNDLCHCDLGAVIAAAQQSEPRKKRRRPGFAEGFSGGLKGPKGEAGGHAPLPATSVLHQTHNLSVRGDARWIGAALVRRAAEELGVAVTDAGSLFVRAGARLLPVATGQG